MDSGIEVSNGAFSTQTYHLSEKIELNQTYTATIWGELDSSKNGYTVYIEDQKGAAFLRPIKVADGIYRSTGKLTSWEFDSKKEHAGIIQILPYPYGAINGTNTIHRIKLEPGINSNPVWTPAPEDIVVQSELEERFNTAPVSDLFEYADNTPISFSFVTTSNATLNTPYKANLTSGFTLGVALVIKYGSYATILYFCVGYHRTFIVEKNNGNWAKSWFEINLTENKITSSDEQSDDMEIN